MHQSSNRSDTTWCFHPPATLHQQHHCTRPRRHYYTNQLTQFKKYLYKPGLKVGTLSRLVWFRLFNNITAINIMTTRMAHTMPATIEYRLTVSIAPDVEPLPAFTIAATTVAFSGGSENSYLGLLFHLQTPYCNVGIPDEEMNHRQQE